MTVNRRNAGVLLAGATYLGVTVSLFTGVYQSLAPGTAGPWLILLILVAAHLALATSRGALESVLAALPVALGLACFWWLEWSPKSSVDPACGFQDYELIAFLPFFALPGLAAGIWSRRSGKSAAATVGLIIGSLLLTSFACIVAFLIWFGKHKCGE